MSSSNSPCAACKCLRRKCTQECVFAPYFPPDQPQKFINVHKVFGASNVTKLLNELNASQREDAVNSLAYEAEYRLRDPVYGCVGLISILQHKLKQVQHDLFTAKKELATYIGPSAMLPIFQQGFIQQHPNNPSSSAVMPFNMQPMMGMPTGVPATAMAAHGTQLIIRDTQQQQQQMLEAQQMAAVVAAREQQEMLRGYEQQPSPQQQHQQHELLRYNSGFDMAVPASATAYNQMNAAAMSPSLALGSFDSANYQIHPHQQPPPEHFHPQLHPHPHPHHHPHPHPHHHPHPHPHPHPHQLQFQSQLVLQQQQQHHHQQQAQPHQPQPTHQQPQRSKK